MLVASLHLPDLPAINLGDLALELSDAPADDAAVDLDLALAGAARADAADHPRAGPAGSARDPFQVRPHAPQPRGRVFELGQLHLQTGLVGAGS